MSIQEQAAYIIVYGARALFVIWLLGWVIDGWNAIQRVRVRRARNRLHEAFVAARVAAREECETRMRAEGYWDNYEIQDAMDRAGRRAAPGYRP